MSESTTFDLRPAARVVGREPYATPTPKFPIDLWLNSNEGPLPPPALLGHARESFCELAGRYPSVMDLQAQLAARVGLPIEWVLVTAGGDDAIARACQAVLDRGRECVLPEPTFEMLDRYATLAGADVVEVEWLRGGFPTAAVMAAISEATSMIAVVSPNNPTGAVASADDLRRLSQAAPRALLLVDLAYVEFADEDLTAAALELPNALVVRTFSKAWGLAGLRVGYALARPELLRWLRATGNPYSVSGLSAELAGAWMRTGDGAMRRLLDAVRAERTELCDVLLALGAEPLPSQANFVLARFRDAAAVWEGLAQRGIAVRAFPGHPQLRDYLRITCPGGRGAFGRLVLALRRTAEETGQGGTW